MILNGKKCAESLFEKLRIQIIESNKNLKLAAILVGENPASLTYLRLKEKKLNELGIDFELKEFSIEISEQELIEEIEKLNEDNSISGIIVQLPLPSDFNSRKILNAVSPKKDIDCLNSENLGNFFAEESDLMPATPLGVIRLLEFYQIDLTGKKICLIGRSNLVGKPLALTLVEKNATVTICHSKTVDLKSETLNSDIVISAVGKAKFLTSDFFKKGQIVIDIGTSNSIDGKLSGDVDFDEVIKIVDSITPVPGGIGPMTIYGLIENLVRNTK